MDDGKHFLDHLSLTAIPLETMGDELALQFKSTLESMGSALQTLSRWLGDRGASEEVCYFANLAVEELATNCMKFGYADSYEHVLEVSLSLTESSLLLTFTDDGRPHLTHCSFPTRIWICRLRRGQQGV
jgi:anti-sigma regulatory factor (Ser/Thr protein kinase)